MRLIVPRSPGAGINAQIVVTSRDQVRCGVCCIRGLAPLVISQTIPLFSPVLSMQISLPARLLSFAAPTLTAVTSVTAPACVASRALVLESCPRQGGTVLTLVFDAVVDLRESESESDPLRVACWCGVCSQRGSNFGADGASVLIGAEPCLNVTHQPQDRQGLLTCVLQPGTAQDRPIVVQQLNGRQSGSSARLNYRLCQVRQSLPVPFVSRLC
jgi:hypothetical protein